MLVKGGPGVLPVLLKDARLKGFVYHICQWENLPIELYGAGSLNKNRSIPNISLVDLLGRDPKYVLISPLYIFLKRKLWILFEPFQKQLSSKYGNFEFILLLILAKRWMKSFAEMSQVICDCLFLPGTSRFISDHIFRGHFCRLYKYHRNRHSFAPW